MRIIVFGDSIAYGAWDPEGGWVARLRRFLDKKLMQVGKSETIVYNSSISGDTTDEILERLSTELKTRMATEKGRENYVIIAIGGNDAAYMHEKKDNWVNADKFRNNIVTVINEIRKAGAKPMCIGITPVDQEKVDPCPWATEISYKNNETRKYESIIQEVCEKEGVPFLPIVDSLGENYKELLYDGVHPNAEGHQKIYERVKGFLTANGVI